VFPLQHLPEVVEPGRRHAAVQHVQRVVLVPPTAAEPVVEVVVDDHAAHRARFEFTAT
jgi:hypothetical protein